MGLVGDNFSRREVIDRLPGTRRDRPQPLFDHRRDHPAQRAAAVLRARRRRLRRRPQRQPHQRPDAAQAAGARRRDHAVDQRHGGDPASRGEVAAQPLHRPLHRRAAPARGRLLVRGADQQEADRRARSARHPPAGDRRARRPSDPRLGNLRARHHRRALCARRRERRGRRVRRERHAVAQAVPAGAAAPLHLRIHLFLAAGFDRRRPRGLRRAQDHGGGARARGARSRPTWSCRCRTSACRPRSASRRNPASPTSSASSATTTSAAPSSSRRSRSASSACG